MTLGYLNYHAAETYRGYTVCPVIGPGWVRYAAMQDGNTWWEAESFEELKGLLDEALDGD